jgi:hypothetical protein
VQPLLTAPAQAPSMPACKVLQSTQQPGSVDPSASTYAHKTCEAQLAAKHTCMKAARVLAPSSGIELYTEARMPPTERWPLSWTCSATKIPVRTTSNGQHSLIARFPLMLQALVREAIQLHAIFHFQGIMKENCRALLVSATEACSLYCFRQGTGIADSGKGKKEVPHSISEPCNM